MPRHVTSAARGTAGHKALRVPLILGLPTAQAVGLVLPNTADKRSQIDAPEEKGPRQ